MSQAREIEVMNPVHALAVLAAKLHAFACSLSVELERTTDTYDSLIRAALAGV